MSEVVVVYQSRDYNIHFLVTDTDLPEDVGSQPIEHIGALGPYSALLVSLGWCTSVLLISYAENHKVPLDGVELRLHYGRDFKEDCENCEESEKYEDDIEQEIVLVGDLDEEQKHKLMLIADQCPIHSILEDGVRIKSRLIELSKLEKKAE